MDIRAKSGSLDKKFQLLYKLGINPSIRSHSDLALALGVSRQAVSKWIHGTDTQLGDRIPPSKLDAVAAVFGIPAHWFDLPFERFKRELLQMIESNQVSEPAVAVGSAARVLISMMPLTDLKAVGRNQELKALTKALKSTDSNIIP